MGNSCADAHIGTADSELWDKNKTCRSDVSIYMANNSTYIEILEKCTH